MTITTENEITITTTTVTTTTTAAALFGGTVRPHTHGFLIQNVQRAHIARTHEAEEKTRSHSDTADTLSRFVSRVRSIEWQMTFDTDWRRETSVL